MKKTAGFLLLLVLAAGGFLAYKSYTFVYTPARESATPEIISIQTGESFQGIAGTLEKKSLITSAWKFRIYGMLVDKDASVKAGEYELSASMTPSQILRILTAGKSILHKLQIVEGLAWWQIGHLVEEAGLGTFEGFSRGVHDTELLQQYTIPAQSAEGYLFPETYFLPRRENQDGREVVETLLQSFWTNAAVKAWPGKRPSPVTMHRVIILASLVEKETSLASERRRIAGVYTNRLERKMLLQCDPTVIYGLGTSFDGNLKRSHLQDSSNPYNTYQHPGLPPGPICSPGLESIKAAINPEKHSYLYFVAKPDGSHHFSRTLREHNNAVYKYQIRRGR